ncbi:MAG: PQQ-binding-like beta-propeller repeat protein [Myxococcota bacterium]|nr:PQQ-binding-like beta-propeller repeat protein [Myxococcota bacterium]
MTDQTIEIRIQDQQVLFTLGGHVRILPNSRATYKALLQVFEDVLAFFALGSPQFAVTLGDDEAHSIQATRHATALTLSHATHDGHRRTTGVTVTPHRFGQVMHQCLTPPCLIGGHELQIQHLLDWSAALSGAVRREDRDSRTLLPSLKEIHGTLESTSPTLIDIGRARIFRMAFRRAWSHSASIGPTIRFIHEAVAAPMKDSLRLIDAKDGTVAHTLPGASVLPGVSTGYVLTSQNELASIEQNGAIAWQAIPIPDETVDALFEHEAMAVIATREGTVASLSAKTGHLIWRHRTFFGAIKSIWLAADFVWMLGEDGLIHQIDGRDGQLVARHPCAHGHLLAHQASARGLVIAENDPWSRQCRIRCLHMDDVQHPWETMYHGRLLDLCIHTTGRVLMLIKAREHLILNTLDGNTGRVVTQSSLSLDGHHYRLFSCEAMVFIKGFDGRGEAYDPETHAYLWSLPADDTGAALNTYTSPIMTKNFLLWPGYTLRVVDPKTGALIQTIYEHELCPQALAITEDGTLLVYDGVDLRGYHLGGVLSLVDSGT